MQKLDKVFAGLLVIAMALFWVIISPAGISSRLSEAKPVIIDMQTVDETRPDRSDIVIRRSEARKAADAQIARLKRRNRDTPAEGRDRLLEGIGEPAIRPEGETPVLQDFDSIPDRPVFN